MFDIGMSELLLIGIVALIVVGPKDLPTLFRTLGRFTARARALGQEFTRAMNDAADEAGVKEAADALRTAANPRKAGLDALKGAADKFEQWEPVSDDKPAGKSEAKPAAERGGETAKLAKERQEAAEKIRAASAAKAEERLARERADAAEEAAPPSDEAADKTGTDPA